MDSDKYLSDRSNILLSSNTAVKKVSKLSTSKHSTSGWNDICIRRNIHHFGQFSAITIISYTTAKSKQVKESYISMGKRFLWRSLYRKQAVLNSKQDSILSRSRQRNIRHHICYNIPQGLAEIVTQLNTLNTINKI